MVAPLFKHARRHPRLLALTLALCVASPFALSGFAESKIEGPIEGAEIAEPIAPFLLLDAALAGSRIVAVGERGYVLLSDDAGRTWRPVRTPLQATLTAVYFADDKSGWAVGHDAVILHTEDGGESWRIQDYAPDLQSPLLDVWFADAKQGLAIGAYGLFLETWDGGETWSSRQISEDDAHHNAIVEAVDGRLYIAGEYGRILRSSDRGETWRALASPYEASFFGILAPPDGTLLVFGLRGRAYRSEDGGTTWGTVVTEALGAGVPVIVADLVGSHPDVINDMRIGSVVKAKSVTIESGMRFASSASTFFDHRGFGMIPNMAPPSSHNSPPSNSVIRMSPTDTRRGFFVGPNPICVISACYSCRTDLPQTGPIAFSGSSDGLSMGPPIVIIRPGGTRGVAWKSCFQTHQDRLRYRGTECCLPKNWPTGRTRSNIAT